MSWTGTPERGSAGALRLMVWLARALGWRLSHALLVPVAGYFLLTAPRRQRAALRRFLARAGAAAGWLALFRQYYAFSATVLDRAFLAAGAPAPGQRVAVEGLAALRARLDQGRGCLLLGAHFGSFEAMRVIAGPDCPYELSVLMHEHNAARIKALCEALGGPGRAASVIPLGRPDTMLRVRECLDRGGLVGLLADRAPRGERSLPVPFLGRPAPLPTGPHLLAAVLGAPVFLAFGLWEGPGRYRVRFEPFADAAPAPPRRDRAAAIDGSVRRYAARLEALCRQSPHNWFNFYDFWDEDDAPERDAVQEAASRPAPADAPPRRRAAAMLGLLALLPRRARADEEAELRALMRALGAVRESVATFEEEKAIPELHLPLPSTGTLRWRAPDRLEKHTESPIAERLLIEGDRLLYERPDRGVRRELSLDEAPELRALVEAVRATLAGDLDTLRRHYEAGFEGTAGGAWQLVLVPRSLRVRASVQRVVIAGRGAQVLAVDTEGGGAGTTRMRITPAR